jgi:anti-anti-sigma regulatory factor
MASGPSGEHEDRIAPRIRVVEGMGARGAITVVVVYGEHDHASRGILRDALAGLETNVIVDLSWCVFLDSSTVAVVLERHAALAEEGLWLELIVPARNREIARAIERLGVGHLVPVLDPAPPLP